MGEGGATSAAPGGPVAVGDEAVAEGDSVTVGPPAASTGRPAPSAPPAWRLGDRPPLTGIRAPLMAFVLIFHSNFQTLPGSWVSLALFFVLSGFLITSMLAGEHQRTGAISLKNFYSRRAVRLLPPLLITVALLAVFASVVRIDNVANAVWGDAAAALFYFADYRSALGHEPAIGWLSQCWSLAVEEQFYLVWAVLFFVALRYATRRTAYVIAIVGVLASTADRMWIVLSAHHYDALVAARAYYAFDTRADALFVGCLLGLVATGGHLDGWSSAARRALSVVTLVSTGVLVWVLFNVGLADRSLPLVWVPVSDVAAVAIITYLLLNPVSVAARLLGIPIVVLLGNMSYAVYLFHWPVYVALSPFTFPSIGSWPFWAYETLRVVIVLILAFASWYLVERPLMRWRRRAFASRGGPEAASAPLVAAPSPSWYRPGGTVRPWP